MAVLELDGVTFGYTAEPVVEDVSLSVESGDFVGVVGPNGSGKSTLLRVALGLLSPDRGSVSLFGEPATRFDDGERLGYVAQDATANATEMPVTVREVVTMGRYAHAGFGRLDDDDHRAVDRALDRVGISDLADRRIGALSGGQRQRTYIARALASDAELLVLDEPTVGVDAESVADFFALLGQLNADGLTVLLVDHDLGRVLKEASTVVCLDCEVRYEGPPGGVVESGALAEAFGTTGLTDGEVTDA